MRAHDFPRSLHLRAPIARAFSRLSDEQLLSCAADVAEDEDVRWRLRETAFRDSRAPANSSYLSLWDLVRVLKLSEELGGVKDFPKLSIRRITRALAGSLSRLNGGSSGGGDAATAADAAAVHALAVFFADRARWEPTDDDDFSENRLRNFFRQHVSPVIVALVRARAWPHDAVVDVAVSIGPRQWLSPDAAAAIVEYGLSSAADGARVIDVAELASGIASAHDAGGAALADRVAAQRGVSALVSTAATRVHTLLDATLADDGELPPLRVLAAFATTLVRRAGVDASAPMPADSSGGSDSWAPVADALARAGELALRRAKESASGESAENGSGADNIAAVVAPALALARAVATLGAFESPGFFTAVVSCWKARWFRGNLPPAVAADVLALAAILRATGPPHLTGLLRLSASRTRTKRGEPADLFLVDGRGVPLARLPATARRGASAAVAAAFSAVWTAAAAEIAERAEAAKPGSVDAIAYDTARALLACDPVPDTAPLHVSAEGVLLDAAVPAARVGVRVISLSNMVPTLDRICASFLAEQTVLEKSEWNIECVIEAEWMSAGPRGAPAIMRRVVERIISAELERKGQGLSQKLTLRPLRAAA